VNKKIAMSSSHRRDINAAAAASPTGGLRGVIAGKMIDCLEKK
jgi:hypothetical protein